MGVYAQLIFQQYRLKTSRVRMAHCLREIKEEMIKIDCSEWNTNISHGIESNISFIIITLHKARSYTLKHEAWNKNGNNTPLGKYVSDIQQNWITESEGLYQISIKRRRQIRDSIGYFESMPLRKTDRSSFAKNGIILLVHHKFVFTTDIYQLIYHWKIKESMNANDF